MCNVSPCSLSPVVLLSSVSYGLFTDNSQGPLLSLEETLPDTSSSGSESSPVSLELSTSTPDDLLSSEKITREREREKVIDFKLFITLGLKMYAYVRYIEDNVWKTVPTHHIENFHPKNLDDFNAEKRYRILWKRTPEESGSYYDGQILKLADYEGDFSIGRIPVPPVESEDEEPASITSGSGIKQESQTFHHFS
ncbi:hypothetical protein GJAV_G00039530 [Gymnothorax javanicus]|nr:hypothetical protein GJAV_G00039530 [Gymnothorax javanicus]